MIYVFPVSTGTLLEILQTSSFRKTLFLEAKTNVFHKCHVSVILIFFSIFVMINFFPIFTGKLLEILRKRIFLKRCM